MKIIIEGSDGTGKTTLCKKLVEKYNLEYRHVTKDDPNTFKFYADTMRDDNVIYDRHLVGEMIYPEVFKRKANFRKKEFGKLLDIAKDEKVVIIVLYSSYITLYKRLKEKGGEYKEVMDKLSFINQEFITIAVKYDLHLINTEATPFEKICEVIENEYK
jgi:broad-specificity NMP kinase